jgi:hypothetical protein
MATRKFTVKGKIMKETPNPLETSVAQALYDLQTNQQMKELGDELKDLFILSAIEVKVAGGRPAIVVFIPYILRVQFRKIQGRLVRELEKKFGKTFVFVAQRRILKVEIFFFFFFFLPLIQLFFVSGAQQEQRVEATEAPLFSHCYCSS